MKHFISNIMIIYRIVEFLLLTLFLYLRLIRSRKFPDLYFIRLTDTTLTVKNHFLFANFAWIIASLMGLILCYHVIKKNKIFSTNKWYFTIANKLVTFVRNALEAFESYIFSCRQDSYDIIKNIVLSYYKKFGYQTYYVILVIMFSSYLLISVCFLYEVFINFRLKLFYTLLPLIMLLLILSYLMRLVSLIVDNLDNIENCIDIKHKFLVDGQDHFVFSVKQDTILSNEIFNSYRIEYLTLYPLRGFLEEYRGIIDQIKPYFQFFMYSSYFIGWSYVLINNLTILM